MLNFWLARLSSDGPRWIWDRCMLEDEHHQSLFATCSDYDTSQLAKSPSYGSNERGLTYKPSRSNQPPWVKVHSDFQG